VGVSVGTWIVVPCYNEAKRLRAEPFLELLGFDGFGFIFVDDGSTDGTATVLTEMCAGRERMRVHHRPKNSGKAEAVRAGMAEAIAIGARETGYLDADCATHPTEMRCLRECLRGDSRSVALGSRVRLLGRRIVRRAGRHYLGRVFATYVSLIVLRMPVYDTQCGAKLFRVSPALRRALAEPFRTRWAFDVELLLRLLSGEDALGVDDFVEVPLTAWIDVRGSKVRTWHMFGVAWDLWRLTVQARCGGRTSSAREVD
jgi:dolichyl-phosphate beta-glucosyltransferase